MRTAGYSFTLMVLILCQCCHNSGARSAGLRTLDSLSGSLNAATTQLSRLDTILLQRSVTRFDYYRQFITENINDTITKDQADNLRHFYSGGESLELVIKNRALILQRAAIVNAQISKLKSDIDDGGNLDLLSKFILKEQAEVLRLTDAAYRQQAIFHRSTSEFRNSIGAVENLLRSRNKGKLPTIIKDTIVI